MHGTVPSGVKNDLENSLGTNGRRFHQDVEEIEIVDIVE